MSGVASILTTVLWLYLLVLLARFVFDLVQMFARDWTPKGPVLVVAEGVYTLTDPPLKAIRRVVPPLRIGGVALDLSFIILLILLQLAIALLSRA